MSAPQTPAQRQAALRRRRAAVGVTEVRGIYLRSDLHQQLKKLARQLAESRNVA